MPTTYGYKVRDREGKLLGGSLEAESEEAVIGRLRQLGYTPLSIEAEKGAGLKTELRLPGTGRVKLKDLAIFSRQFATMINSGLSLLRALTILGEQTANRRLGEVVGQIRAEVETGMSLSAAMAKHPKIFNRLYVSMVRAGEIGGFLDQVLVKVAETFEKEVALRGKIRSAMTYPVVVFVMVMAGLAFAYKRWRATPAGRYRLDQFKLKVKVFGPLFHKSALSRFARTLATLIRSGVPILQALEIVAETVNNGVISRAIRDVQDSVREGESLATPLAKHPTFPAMVVQMMAVGEETGALDTMLTKAADF